MKDMGDEKTQNAELDMVDKSVDDLRKYFDCVQIFVSKVTAAEDVSIGRDPDNTIYITRGSGNLLARLGQTQLWIDYQREVEKDKARQT